MKKYTQFLTEARRLTPDQVRSVIKKYVDNEDDRDSLDAVLSKIYHIPVEKNLIKFLKSKGLTGQAVNEMAAILPRMIVSSRTATASEKLDFVNELEAGEVYNVKAVIDDSVNSNSPTNIFQSKYMTSTNTAITKEFISWFWKWEPQFDKRNVGGGETLMILCDPQGNKGGEGGKGDANLGPSYNIEIKKSQSKKETHDSAASFGNNSNFGTARTKYVEMLQAAYKKAQFMGGPPDASELRDSYLPASGSSGDGSKISIAINDTTYRLSQHCGYNDHEVENFISEICTTAHGIEANSRLMNGVVSKGVADPNKFIRRWVAAGMAAYQKKQGFDVLFYFDSMNGNALGFRHPGDMLRKEDFFDVDWVLNWKEGGYGHATPRLFVPPSGKARKVNIVRDTKQIERNELGVARLKAFDALTTALAKANRRPSSAIKVRYKGKETDVMQILSGMPEGVYKLPGYDAIKTQEQADSYKLLKSALYKTYGELRTASRQDGLEIPKYVLSKVGNLAANINTGIRRAGFN